jgi:DNA-binding beta-propeller fold protein YncE
VLHLNITLSCHKVISFNQPKLCPTATWHPNATTFADNNTVGTQPYNLFIDTDNTIHVTATRLHRVVIWSNATNLVTRIITGNLTEPIGIFVTATGQIFVDNGRNFSRVDRWNKNNTLVTTSIMIINGTCFSLFLDVYDDLYCSHDLSHRVIKQISNNSQLIQTVVAGNVSAGFSNSQLNLPRGIFVRTDFTLIVADCGNDRVQQFLSGSRQGTTLISNITFGLNCPTGVTADADGYLFIVDGENHRIIGQNMFGFRCIVGCSNTSGNGAHQLNGPRSLSFDRDGNLFVVDRSNNRVQRFALVNNNCGL